MMRAMLIKILNEKSKTYDLMFELLKRYEKEMKKKEEDAVKRNDFELAKQYFAIRMALEDIKLELLKMYNREISEVEKDIIE